MKKKIFKKNRLVIFALSVMIGVAGYLNFNAGKRDDLLRQKAKETNADPSESDVLIPWRIYQGISGKCISNPL